MPKYNVDDRSNRSLGFNFGCISADYTCISANTICPAADSVCMGTNGTCSDISCFNSKCMSQLGCSGEGFGGGSGGVWFSLPGSNK